MKGLLLKDFYNTKKSMVLMMIIPFVMAIVAYAGFLDDGTETEGFRAFLVIMPAAISAIFSVSLLMNTLVWDENSNYLLYALTTPIDKKLYLKSKYIYLLMATGGYALISVIPMTAVLILTGSFRPELIFLLFGTALIGVIVALLLGTCLMALSMKYTAIKANGYMTMFYGLFAFSGVILNHISEETRTLIKENIGYMAVAVVVILAVFAVMLFQKSCQWLEQKEF